MPDLPITPIIPTSLSVNGLPPPELAVRFSDWIDVRDYGAVGDGVVDDTDAIQDAIDACQASGVGGVVLLSSGLYKISSPLTITQHHVSLVGPGPSIGFDPSGGQRGGAVLQPTSAAAFNGSAVIRVGQSGTPTASLKSIVLRGFTIAGYNLPANADGIYAEMGGGLICEIRIENVTRYGIHLDSVVATDACFNDIFHNLVYQPGSSGMFFDDAPDNRISENTIYQAGSHGIESASPGLVIHNNYIEATGKAVSAPIYDAKVLNNRIQHCNGGVYLNDTGNTGLGGFQVVGNKLWNCSKATDNTTDSINIDAGSTAIRGAGVISGNSFWTDNTNGNRARYHINIVDSNVQEAVIGANSYGFVGASSSYGTAAINNDGTRTQIAPFVIARSGTSASHTGDTNGHTFATITIPGGLMGKNGQLRISTLWSMTNNANFKSVFVFFGSTPTGFYSNAVQSCSSLQLLTNIANRGAQNSQVGSPSTLAGPGQTTAARTTATEDTSANQNVTLTGQLANGADTITLESYTVEVLPG